ncbi:unnamed protein product [Linum trigynum]|uniref:E3 ubiquitin-protein ligase LIN-1 n=1 Tax=Linum trigynum TaxID=586398 RepID=A0AAV2FI05_9ROSI
MASSISSSHDEETPDIESTKSVVSSITDHIHQLISSPSSWNSLKSASTSRLSNIVQQNQENHFELSEHSVISNLYWGIEAIDSAMQAQEVEEGRTSGLKKAESMLQVPALLEEDGVTAGIHNQYLICCSYFFLSVVKKLQNDEWQVALHFFQAVMVSPRLVRVEFAPRVCEDLFHESCNDEDVRRMARRYKHRLMYYQVMLYGDVGKGSVEHKPQSFRQLLSWRNDPLETYCNKLVQYEKVHPFDSQSCEIEEVEDYQPQKLDVKKDTFRKDKSTRSLQEVLMESESDTETTSVSSCCNYHVEEGGDHPEETINEGSIRYIKGSEDNQFSLVNPCEYKSLPLLVNEEKPKITSGRIVCSVGHRDRKTDSLLSCYAEDDHHGRITMEDLRRGMMGKNEKDKKKKHKKKKKNLLTGRDFSSQLAMHNNEQGSETELVLLLEKAISRLCFSEEEEDYDYAIQVTTIYEMLSKKRGVKYNMLKNVILDQLLVAISTSKEERVIRASVSILSTIVLVNNSAVEEIKRKGLSLYNLATALKQKVHEAAILIYLINPSPTEIKTLELLPALVEVVCTCSKPMLTTTMRSCQLVLTPPAASLMIMEVLVTAFDCDTNNMHLESINSPQVLGRLVEVAKMGSFDEHVVSLARILVKCMQFGGDCRRYISESVPLDAFACLLQRKEKRAKLSALEFFQEILCIPRSSATSLLQGKNKGIFGSSNLMQILLDCIQEIETDHKLLAASLLLQLDTLEDSSNKSMFTEEALKVILNGLSNEQSSTSQQLAAFILANIGGTYAWNGEPYTSVWLVKKGGLTSLTHRNLVKNFNQLDQTLQDIGIDPWCAKITKRVVDMGKPVFQALATGLRSKIKRVRLNSLTAISWIGCEIGKYPNSIRYSACEILLSGLEQFLHPGMELEHRFLACMCIYNYASGKGMQKLINFSEGVRESLRRLSSVTWMAEELHRVADYYLPNRSRISCVHTQVLEAKHSRSGAVTALIYYKGLLFSGYSDGSIKVWEIKDQTASLAFEMKEHRKAVTCFSLLEHGESLLSGSADKTIRVWQMVQRKLECIEVISVNESIRKLETYGHMVFAITHSHGIKVFDSSRTANDICKSKKVKTMTTSIQGKIYLGCKDASIQEFSITSNREREIKAPVKNWMMQSKPINSIVVYKDWLYTAGSLVEGSKVKEWRTNCRPQVSMVAEKGKSVVAMEVVEDFIYLNCSSSTSSLQIWLRGTQQKVGRISAGSKITSLLCANDIVLCGTEKGLIKGWIPL